VRRARRRMGFFSLPRYRDRGCKAQWKKVLRSQNRGGVGTPRIIPAALCACERRKS
jgi:hypothetical protein